jgi:hypothetical protein
MTKTRSSAAVAVVTVLLLMPALVGAGQKPVNRPSNPQANIFLENSLVRISVDDTDGSFGIGTSSTNPRPCESLLYGFSCGGSSSTTNIKVRVDGQVWDVLGSTGSCDGDATFVSAAIVGGSIESRYTIPTPQLSILVKHTPVLFDATTGAILTETFVTNNDPTGAPHDIGVLYEYDTEVADNDSSEIAAGGTWYPNETCFPSVPFTYWEAFEDQVPPQAGDLIGRGTVTGGAAVTPDRFAIGYWSSMVDACWDYTCSGDPYGDSAVIYWWDEASVAASATRRVGTYYGVGSVQIAQGDLAISLSAPSTLQCDGVDITPNPFGLTAFVTNTTGGTCTNVVATLTPNSGLSTGDPLAVNLGSLTSGQTLQAYWDVTASGDPCGGAIGYSVQVVSADCETNTATSAVTVPCCTGEVTPTPTSTPRVTPTPAMPVPALGRGGLLIFVGLLAALGAGLLFLRRT